MSDAIKNWLPITKRNRVALGFAFAALVMFVTWNCLPDYQSGRLVVMANIWIEIANPRNYLTVIRSPDMEGFLGVAVCMALLLNGLVVLAIVPFWKILHSSNYLRMPLAVANFAGGLVILWFILKENADYSAPYEFAIDLLVVLTMFALSAALFIFKNELGLRHELEVRRMMAGGDFL